MVQETGRKGDNALVDIIIEFLEKQGFTVTCQHGDDCAWDASITFKHPPVNMWMRIRDLTVFSNWVHFENRELDAHDPEFFNKLQHLIDNPPENIMSRLFHSITGNRRYEGDNFLMNINFLERPDSSTDRALDSESRDEGSIPSRGNILAKWVSIRDGEEGDSGEIDIGNGMKMRWQTKVFKEEKEEEMT